MNIFISLILGYVFGCFSTGYFVGKIYKVDIRQYGSGNSGTTNALRTLGKRAGILTLLGDVSKAIIPLLLIKLVFFKGDANAQILALYTGLGVVLGHNYPFWLKFKGGKGIATTGGVMIVFDWIMVAPALLIFLGTIAVTKYVSLGSLLVSIFFPIWIFFTNSYDIHMLIVSLLYTILAFIKHIPNIKRLINGSENKITQKVNINNK